MKLKLKRLGSTLIVILLTYCTVQGLGHLCRTKIMDQNTGGVEVLHSLEENSVEVLAIGSSHVHRSVKPMSMYKNYGIGIYDYTASGQRANQTLLFLKDSLLTQKPKVVMIETYKMNKFDFNSVINYQVLLTSEINSLSGKVQYLRDAFQDDLEKYATYLFPIFVYHERWTDLKEWSFKPSSYPKSYLKSMGYRKLTKTQSVSLPKEGTVNQKDFSNKALKNLDEMVEICKNNDIEIVFFTTPFEGGYQYADAMEKYAEENNCAYINFFTLIDELGIDENTDFSDEDHLNDKGAEKISDYLGRYLAEHYDLTDMRTVEGNIWQQQLDK